MDAIFVLFLLSSPPRQSSVSVVFDFNTSLNDVAPVSPMLFPVDLMKLIKSRSLIDTICALFLLFSQLRSSSVSVVFDCNASLIDAAPVFPMLFTVDLVRMEKSELLMDVICVLFLWFSHLRLSFMSVVFVFNVSLNDVVPVSPILLSVYLKIMKNSVLLMNTVCVLFLLSSPHRLSSMSVVFDFNASLNDAAPLSPILFPVDLMGMEKEWIVGGCNLCIILFVLPARSSFVSVVFDFNASLIDTAIVSPMLFPVDLMRIEMSGLLI